jgi:hypothetical protein
MCFYMLLDPPVIYFWKWIGGRTVEKPKNRNLESVCVPTHLYPPGALTHPPGQNHVQDVDTPRLLVT